MKLQILHAHPPPPSDPLIYYGPKKGRLKVEIAMTHRWRRPSPSIESHTKIVNNARLRGVSFIETNLWEFPGLCAKALYQIEWYKHYICRGYRFSRNLPKIVRSKRCFLYIMAYLVTEVSKFLNVIFLSSPEPQILTNALCHSLWKLL